MIVGAFALHRGQITFDYMDMETGDIRRGRIAPADRAPLRAWLMRFDEQEAAFAVEGCTGWRYVVEELVRAGVVPHLAEPPFTSAAIWAEMGDCRRFSSSDQAVRHTGLDVTVWSSDKRRSPGRLSRQGPPVLRWALYEAAKNASRASSPDHAYYQQTRERLGAKRATISVARKLARRAFHILTNLGDQALAEAA